MKEFIIHDGIVQIGLKDTIIGVFDIHNYKYYSINASLLGKFITLYIKLFGPESDAACPRPIFEYLRRNRVYKIKIAYQDINPIIYDITRIWHNNIGTGWPSKIEINNKIYDGYFGYCWDEDTGIWLFNSDIGRCQIIKTAWGPHTIEIKEMKKENTTMNWTDSLAYRYCTADVSNTVDIYKQLANSFYGLKPKNMYLPKIKNVVISEPYTTIMWKDGSKTQVKCMDGDQFNPEHGLAMAVLKKLMEKPDKPNAYSKWVKQWVKQGIEAGEKQVARKNKKAEKKAEKEVCDSCSWAFDKDGNVQTGPTNIDYSNT